ncbi:MAG TPA: hypothetical protein VM864_00540 [Pyrinomonadaceae bacterium]|jgi:hypothetical protein|nr:hypothetical protein [Pyrinomonadaceae bacterium]
MACVVRWKTFARAARLSAVAVALLSGAGCDRRGAQTTNARPPKSDFERSIDTVRRGQYVKIYVIRRKDGEPLQPDDKAYLRASTPMETGMWIVTEDNRTAIAGAGFEFEPKHLDALAKRFTVEDYTNK